MCLLVNVRTVSNFPSCFSLLCFIWLQGFLPPDLSLEHIYLSLFLFFSVDMSVSFKIRYFLIYIILPNQIFSYLYILTSDNKKSGKSQFFDKSMASVVLKHLLIVDIRALTGWILWDTGLGSQTGFEHRLCCCFCSY